MNWLVGEFVGLFFLFYEQVTKWKSAFKADQKEWQISWKKSGFVDSGLVKTCDELVIGHGKGSFTNSGFQMVRFKWQTIQTDAIRIEHSVLLWRFWWGWSINATILHQYHAISLSVHFFIAQWQTNFLWLKNKSTEET